MCSQCKCDVNKLKKEKDLHNLPTTLFQIILYLAIKNKSPDDLKECVYLEKNIRINNVEKQSISMLIL